ncbi:DUF3502 domain-containing protein [Paenibacillus sp. LMG 31458]|uniref:DUF3502 domain-containing protein n=1 Tax=Paenibacillus phytorum TaxID=2654977 RepID=A0ABX1XS46_9BACL|nr:ABC transporter substrate-binding protein [Paenibacillus phytorum]NOU71370.1 DUF3502 domain-containing protein [Paenibacillus phytorum]
MMKKKLSLCTTLVIGASLLLSACGSNAAKSTNETASASPTSSASAGASASPAALKPVELTWYTVGTPQKDQPAVMEEINKILKEKINATLKLNVIDWGAYDDKMKVITSTNENYDLAFTSSWANNYAANVLAGAYVPLDDLLKKYGQDILKQVPAKYWDATKVSGKIYGSLNYQTYYISRGLAFNKGLVEKYNFDVKSVKKPSDLTPFLEKVKSGEPGTTGYLPAVTGFPELFNMETGFTIDAVQGNSLFPLMINVNDKNMKVFDGVESKEFMDLMKVYRDWYQKGYIRKDAVSLKDYKAEAKSGKYAVWARGGGPGASETATAEQGYPAVVVDSVPSYINTGGVIATMTAISKTSKNPERAMMLLDLLYSDKQLYRLLSDGIEGKHYKKVDDNTMEAIADSGYAPGTNWEFGNMFNDYASKGSPVTLDQLKQLNDTSATSPLLGFLYNPDSLKQEYAQVNAIMGEMIPALMTGTVDPETSIPKYVDRMKKAGLDKLTDDAQKQINDWKAANGK